MINNDSTKQTDHETNDKNMTLSVYFEKVKDSQHDQHHQILST